jgi:hypothetical protein
MPNGGCQMVDAKWWMPNGRMPNADAKPVVLRFCICHLALFGICHLAFGIRH